jgi:hypothetical protein
VEPAAVLVSARIMERISRQVGNVPVLVWSQPQRESFVIDRHVLFRFVEHEELRLEPEQLLPPTVILLARPSADCLNTTERAELLRLYWRRLFRVRVRLALGQRASAGTFDAGQLRQRIAALGAAAFDEVRRVLAEEGQLAAQADDMTAYCEFAACYEELCHFAPHLLTGFFPGLREPARVEAIIGQDIDAAELLVKTRLAGAAERLAPVVTEDEEPNEYYWQLMEEAKRAEAAGNLVRAAIVRTRAARVAPADLSVPTNRAAQQCVQQLLARLQAALALSDAEAAAWQQEMPGLLDKADQGSRPIEAALLYDLQNICLNYEREVYALDLVEWLLSAGRRPIKRPLPSQRLVRIVRLLRSARGRVARTRLSGGGRLHLAQLFDQALERNEDALRSRFRTILVETMRDVGLRPATAPERAALDKMVEELLDRIVGYGFLTFSDLRDAISRNQLKLPDLTDPEQFVRGDPLLRLDRRLATLLDGVYHPSEFYTRWLERATALGFGTRTGRWLTQHVTFPFGAALIVIEVCNILAGHIVGLALETLSQVVLTLLVGVFLLGVMRVAAFQRQCKELALSAGRGCKRLLVDLPLEAVAALRLRRLLASWPVRLGALYAIKPALLCALLWVYFPDAFTTPLGAAGIFLACSFGLNTRLGIAVGEAVRGGSVHFYDMLRGGLLPALVRLVLALFKRIIDAVDYALFSVDEWLRFRSGDGPLSLIVRTVLGVVWFPISYVARFYMIVLIEPGLNPIKFPLASVAAKFIYPFGVTMTTFLAGLLAPVVGNIAAGVCAGATIWLLPDAFAFIIWEMKENWSLYRANRSPVLQPVTVGPHGETVVQLLRPGFHSGTLGKLFARLRRAEAGASTARGAACHHTLAVIAQALRVFVLREMLAPLQMSSAWHAIALGVGRIELASNTIAIELTHPAFPDRPVRILFEERLRCLRATLAAPGWLGELDLAQRRDFAAALVRLYKLAGVELVHEQIQAVLPEDVEDYQATPDRLTVWHKGAAQPAVYLLDAPDSSLHARPLIFAALPVPWQSDGAVPSFPYETILGKLASTKSAVSPAPGQ